MNVSVTKLGMVISPENVLEEVFLERILGFDQYGCHAVRIQPEDGKGWGRVELVKRLLPEQPPT